MWDGVGLKFPRVAQKKAGRMFSGVEARSASANPASRVRSGPSRSPPLQGLPRLLGLRTAHLSFAGTDRVLDLRSCAEGRITSGAIAE